MQSNSHINTNSSSIVNKKDYNNTVSIIKTGITTISTITTTSIITTLADNIPTNTTNADSNTSIQLRLSDLPQTNLLRIESFTLMPFINRLPRNRITRSHSALNSEHQTKQRAFISRNSNRNLINQVVQKGQHYGLICNNTTIKNTITEKIVSRHNKQLPYHIVTRQRSKSTSSSSNSISQRPNTTTRLQPSIQSSIQPSKLSKAISAHSLHKGAIVTTDDSGICHIRRHAKEQEKQPERINYDKRGLTAIPIFENESHRLRLLSLQHNLINTLHIPKHEIIQRTEKTKTVPATTIITTIKTNYNHYMSKHRFIDQSKNITSLQMTGSLGHTYTTTVQSLSNPTFTHNLSQPNKLLQTRFHFYNIKHPLFNAKKQIKPPQTKGKFNIWKAKNTHNNNIIDKHIRGANLHTYNTNSVQINNAIQFNRISFESHTTGSASGLTSDSNSTVIINDIDDDEWSICKKNSNNKNTERPTGRLNHIQYNPHNDSQNKNQHQIQQYSKYYMTANYPAVYQNLVFLDLYNNQIERISNLDGLPSLSVLLLGKNRIRDISGVASLHSTLRILDLHGNKITNIASHLSCLHELKSLNLAGNQLCQINQNDFKGLVKLKELNLKRNHLKRINGFQYLQALEHLWLCNNDLHRVEDIASIIKVPTLLEVTIENNPVSLAGDCVSFLVSYLPKLQMLSQMPITENVRKAAITWRFNKEQVIANCHRLTTEKYHKLRREEIISNARTNWELLRSQQLIQTTFINKEKLHNNKSCDNKKINEHQEQKYMDEEFLKLPLIETLPENILDNNKNNEEITHEMSNIYNSRQITSSNSSLGPNLNSSSSYDNSEEDVFIMKNHSKLCTEHKTRSNLKNPQNSTDFVNKCNNSNEIITSLNSSTSIKHSLLHLSEADNTDNITFILTATTTEANRTKYCFLNNNINFKLMNDTNQLQQLTINNNQISNNTYNNMESFFNPSKSISENTNICKTEHNNNFYTISTIPNMGFQSNMNTTIITSAIMTTAYTSHDSLHDPLTSSQTIKILPTSVNKYHNEFIRIPSTTHKSKLHSNVSSTSLTSFTIPSLVTNNTIITSTSSILMSVDNIGKNLHITTRAHTCCSQGKVIQYKQSEQTPINSSQISDIVNNIDRSNETDYSFHNNNNSTTSIGNNQTTTIITTITTTTAPSKMLQTTNNTSVSNTNNGANTKMCTVDREREEGGDYLIEICGRYLNIYGQGALRFLDKQWNPSKANDVHTINFSYINFNNIISIFARIKLRFPHAEHFVFRETNLMYLGQLNALAELQGISSLQIDPKGNIITSKELWRSYAIYRLAHWGLKMLNNLAITPTEIDSANRTFDGLSELILWSIPDVMLQPLLKRLNLNESCSASRMSPKQWLMKSENESLRLVVGKEALQWKKNSIHEHHNLLTAQQVKAWQLQWDEIVNNSNLIASSVASTMLTTSMTSKSKNTGDGTSMPLLTLVPTTSNLQISSNTLNTAINHNFFINSTTGNTMFTGNFTHSMTSAVTNAVTTLSLRECGKINITLMMENTCNAVEKLHMLKTLWPSMLFDMVRNTLIDYSQLDAYIRNLMSELMN